MVDGRDVFGVGVRDSVCVVAAGRLGGVFTWASVIVRETGRFSTAFVRAVGRAVLAGFVKVEGRASPGFGRAALGSRCAGICDACKRRASVAFVRACGVELRCANAAARASGLLRFSGAN